MDEQRKFLSDRLLSEELPVTYRLLSRAMDLHVNHAKAALYEFHKYQNGLRANSVFATYLISGTKPLELDADIKFSPDDDDAVHDSPTSTITLVTEEKLEDILAEYQQVDSIHVYSLSPHPQRDIALLSDVAKSISGYTGKQDGEDDEARKVYGTIFNPWVRRKERKGAVQIPPPSSAPKPVIAKSLKTETVTTTPKATQPVSKVKQESTETPSTGSTPSSSTGKKPVASLRRGESGSIMQSFAKAAARPPAKSTPASKRKKEDKEDEDTIMAMSDDGEADDSDLPPPTANKSAVDKTTSDAEAAALQRSRKDREMELRRMMDEVDGDEDDGEETKEKAEAGDEDEEMAEAEAEDLEAEAEPTAAAEEKPQEIISASSNGRRRGKRRVMKKKRILDEQGYMVTIQEEGWESFSEDEPPPKAAAPKPSIAASTATPTSSASKAKKPGAKSGAGQGSIMSFFTKK